MNLNNRLSVKKKIVIKVGTSSITHPNGSLNIRQMRRFTRIVSDIKNSGRDIILVSSGSIGLGMGLMGLKTKPEDIPSKQALSAVGQCELMNIYDDMFGKYSVKVGQVLLTKNLVDERIMNVRNTFNKLLEYGVLPIVNENDSVAIDELYPNYGENDTLSAVVSVITGAELLIILSDIDGLFEENPKENPDAKLIPVVNEISDHIKEISGGRGSALGTGGMSTKIEAAKIAMENGIDMVIMNIENPERLYDLILDDKPVGTLFRNLNY
ncbi:MAG: glutamate 5-kinase [Ruminococcus sp.]|jgi:glutamate 5-kinase|nr:glutamate 5-kinase [Ruminococcus sp.]